ncbi:hypothetical protein VP01_3121g2 [Puccinia sorghi]|uniref:Major facilitator superfamily (MFS) profile domain-containing protein n=1 Tax=Puccinia sorghi TaxID=27349 RepID=A0A0L6UZF5_9BASI|nr:hypothetical protein VP01_3121g2 [Puccinia sorghi]
MHRLVLGLLLNITFGFLSHIIPAQLLMVLGCMGTAISCLLSAIMDTSASYWTYNFASVALSVVGPDFVFATGTMYGSQISSPSEQAVTGGVFHTFAQMGNAIGLSLATMLQIQVTRSRSREEGRIVVDDLTVASPQAFLQGLRAGFWLCFGSLCLATLLCVVFLRNLKLLGKTKRQAVQQVEGSVDKSAESTPASASSTILQLEKGEQHVPAGITHHSIPLHHPHPHHQLPTHPLAAAVPPE